MIIQEPNVPYGPLWHKPLSMVSVDSFLSTNGLTQYVGLGARCSR